MNNNIKEAAGATVGAVLAIVHVIAYLAGIWAIINLIGSGWSIISVIPIWIVLPELLIVFALFNL